MSALRFTILGSLLAAMLSSCGGETTSAGENTSTESTSSETAAETSDVSVPDVSPLESDGEQPQVGQFGPLDPKALPFRYEVKEIKSPPGNPPQLHSFVYATVPDGHWLMMGGRGRPTPPKPNADVKTGLHGFTPSSAPPEARENFPSNSFNKHIWVYHPVTGEKAKFDTTELDNVDRKLAAALRTTSQQFWYDRKTDMLWIVGGYGWKEDHSDMVTFKTMLRVSASKLASAVLAKASAENVATLFERLEHKDLAVTGGEMVMVDNVLYLVFGQQFDGQYFAFGGDDPEPFTQIYTEKIFAISMNPNKFEILDVSSVGNGDPDECHRRDLNVRMTKDATTGKSKIGVYGGVFTRGTSLGFKHPITYDTKTRKIEVHEDGVQLFNAYATAATTVWAEKDKVMSQIFFGGIGIGVYHTHAQTPGLDNDHMPFGSDISVMTQEGDGSWQEYVLPDPVPDNTLLAANGHFFVNPKLHEGGEKISDSEIILLDKLPEGQKTVVGWVYGGILADLPQPPKGPPKKDKDPHKAVEVPSQASNKIFEISLTRGVGPAIPVTGE